MSSADQGGLFKGSHLKQLIFLPPSSWKLLYSPHHFATKCLVPGEAAATDSQEHAAHPSQLGVSCLKENATCPYPVPRCPQMSS